MKKDNKKKNRAERVKALINFITNRKDISEDTKRFLLSISVKKV